VCGVHTLTFDMTTTETVTLRLVRLYHCPGPPVERKRASSVTIVPSYAILAPWQGSGRVQCQALVPHWCWSRGTSDH